MVRFKRSKWGKNCIQVSQGNDYKQRDKVLLQSAVLPGSLIPDSHCTGAGWGSGGPFQSIVKSLFCLIAFFWSFIAFMLIVLTIIVTSVLPKINAPFTVVSAPGSPFLSTVQFTRAHPWAGGPCAHPGFSTDLFLCSECRLLSPAPEVLAFHFLFILVDHLCWSFLLLVLTVLKMIWQSG